MTGQLDSDGLFIIDDSYESLLSPKLRTVLYLFLQGKSTRDIAQELNITHNSAQDAMKRIYASLGVSGGMPALVADLIERGWLTWNPH